MKTPFLLFAAFIPACLALTGCSSDGGRERSHDSAPVKGPNGTGGQAGMGGKSDEGSFGNSNGMNNTMSGSGGMGPTMTPPMMGTGSKIDPISIDQCGDQNPAGLSVADAAKLMAGSGNAGAMRLLYPYNGTVFPRGLLAPLLMWDGGDGESVYVHMKANRLEYKGCLKPSAPGQVALPEDVWKSAGEKTMGTNDPFTLELSWMSGGVATGPVSAQIIIAQATLKGSIFYNSYVSMLPGAATDPGGAPANPFGMPGQSGSVLRIPPGGTAERFTGADCNGCHSVSANGSRLLSSIPLDGALSFALDPMSQPNPPSMRAGPRGAYGGLYPDGSMYLATSAVIDVARGSLVQALDAPVDATLYETDTGTVLASTGIPTGALMPMFSPDGQFLVFNDYAIGNAHGLALMDFDATTKTAANYRMLFMDSELSPAWPFMLPDNLGVVFTRTTSAEFSGEGVVINGSTVGPSSEVYVVDIASGKSVILAQAMGYATPEDAASGTTYLPFGAEELKMAYYPTISPVAAGGYFWLLFDSVRHYGNLGIQRQLWCAAISISADGTYAADLSHPAFYLPGQEFGTANHRAFAALDPCKQDGNDCTSGVDCCGGFCTIPPSTDDEFGTEPKGTCGMDKPRCSRTNERCTTDMDCCPTTAPDMDSNTCIAGFCAQPPAGPD